MLMFTEGLSEVGRECPDPLYTVTRLASNDLETGTALVAQGVFNMSCMLKKNNYDSADYQKGLKMHCGGLGRLFRPENAGVQG